MSPHDEDHNLLGSKLDTLVQREAPPASNKLSAKMRIKTWAENSSHLTSLHFMQLRDTLGVGYKINPFLSDTANLAAPKFYAAQENHS